MGHMMKRLLAAVILAAVPVFGQAATFSIDNVTGVWSSVEARGNAGRVAGVGTNRISWGRPFAGPLNPGMEKSSYRFNGLTADPTRAGQSVNLGRFTHNNFEITGKTLKHAILDVVINGVWRDGGITQAFTLVTQFAFNHNETPNHPKSGSCAFGVPPCADVVTPTQNAGQTATFDVNGKTFEFVQTGFLGIGSQFVTREGKRNRAVFQGRFHRVKSPNPPTDEPPTDEPPVYEPPTDEPPLAPVPLPASAALLGVGLAALGLGRRRAG